MTSPPLDISRLGSAVIEMTIRDMRKLEALLTRNVSRPRFPGTPKQKVIHQKYFNGVHAWECLFYCHESVSIWADSAGIDIERVRENARREFARLGEYVEAETNG
jgi:hypothetical protein